MAVSATIAGDVSLWGKGATYMEHFTPSHSLFFLKLKQSNSFKPVKLKIGGHNVMTRSTEQITGGSWCALQVNVTTSVNKVQ